MIENGFYKIKQDFIDLINNQIGGCYQDTKLRPVFCCMEDKYIKGIFWGIPTSDLSHRTPDQIKKYESYCALDINESIRASYYHLGFTNIPALYRISSCLPIIDKYIDEPYSSQGGQLFLKSRHDIEIIRKKLNRILLYERQRPNTFEQHITDIRDFLKSELINP